MKFDTKIAVILREDLATWQKLNITAFTVSGIAGTVEGIIGEPYEDASGVTYLPMVIQPMLIFSGTADQLRTVYDRARANELTFAVFTEELFTTGNDVANRAAVKAVKSEDLKLVGMAMRGDKKVIDKIVKGLSMHQ